MNKDNFISLLRNYRNLSGEDLKELSLLSDEFPFSQALHNLVAKGAMDMKAPEAKTKLGTAAIYSPDRAALKRLIEGSVQFVAAVHEESLDKSIETPAAAPKTETPPPPPEPEKIDKPVTQDKVPHTEMPAAEVKTPEPVSKPASVQDLVKDPTHQAKVEALRNEIFSNLKELQKNIVDSNKVFDFYDKKHENADAAKKKAVQDKGKELKELEESAKAKLSGREKAEDKEITMGTEAAPVKEAAPETPTKPKSVRKKTISKPKKTKSKSPVNRTNKSAIKKKPATGKKKTSKKAAGKTTKVSGRKTAKKKTISRKVPVKKAASKKKAATRKKLKKAVGKSTKTTGSSRKKTTARSSKKTVKKKVNRTRK